MTKREAAEEIIRNGDCLTIRCAECPLYDSHTDACTAELGELIDEAKAYLDGTDQASQSRYTFAFETSYEILKNKVVDAIEKSISGNEPISEKDVREYNFLLWLKERRA